MSTTLKLVEALQPCACTAEYKLSNCQHFLCYVKIAEQWEEIWKDMVNKQNISSQKDPSFIMDNNRFNVFAYDYMARGDLFT